ncbi:PfkB family carbohydrate kinase [Arthrobacter roseus]|uniref:PfkB family carbohydrate kinase n=1 Tax=Arthrobacter roseus TaxID=136274 RepID=UPI0019638E08|nr:fructokinase [Arthrobacter roseus]
MLTVIGEALVDRVVSDTAPTRSHVGGSPMNVAVGVARLGYPAQFIGRYGNDDDGRLIAEHLRANRVIDALGPDDHRTSVAVATLDPVGSAAYAFDLDWDLPALIARLPELLDGTTLLHTGSIASMLTPGAREVLTAVEHARPAATISYDPNCRPTIITDRDYARGQAEKFVALADIVKASDEDLQWLYPERDAQETARAWLAMGTCAVVVTRGSKGPWAIAASGEATVKTPVVGVVDTVGAGDSFMAALLAATVRQELDGGHRREQLRSITVKQLKQVLTFASAAAAVTVSRAGANPPNRAELKAQLGENT